MTHPNRKVIEHPRCPERRDLPSVPCDLCSTPTAMTGTRRCNRCWELEHRIHADPELAKRILADLIISNHTPFKG